MATVNDWNKYMTLLHELALVENDLRTAARGNSYAAELLWEHF